jgi:hypothetical protein
MSAAWIVIGWPDAHDRRTIRNRRTGELIGYIRSTPDPVRYFAEDRNGFPIEGTFYTRHNALDALIESTRR